MQGMSISFPGPAALCAKCHRHRELSQPPQEPSLAQFLTPSPSQSSQRSSCSWLGEAGRGWQRPHPALCLSLTWSSSSLTLPIPGNTHLQHLLPALQCLLPRLQKVNIFPWNRKLVIVLLLTGLIIICFCDLFYPAQNQCNCLKTCKARMKSWVGASGISFTPLISS